jgi:hypothetical protein
VKRQPHQRRQLGDAQRELLLEVFPTIVQMARRRAWLAQGRISADDLAGQALLTCVEVLLNRGPATCTPACYLIGVARYDMVRELAAHGSLITVPRRNGGYHQPLTILSLDAPLHPGGLLLRDLIEEDEVQLQPLHLPGNGQSKMQVAIAFLHQALAAGARPAKEVIAEAQALGIALNTLYKAREYLKVKSRCARPSTLASPQTKNFHTHAGRSCPERSALDDDLEMAHCARGRSPGPGK